MTTKENPAPRANAGSRANSKSVNETSYTTNPAAPPDAYRASRFRLPVPVGALVARLSELGRALS
jgi:hypothetical protein